MCCMHTLGEEEALCHVGTLNSAMLGMHVPHFIVGFLLERIDDIMNKQG